MPYLTFFKGAGVSLEILAPHTEALKNDKESFNKYVVTSEILEKINEHDDRAIRERRELIKRITEFQDFSVCWDNDRAAAIGLVSQIRDIVNVKDSFTRMRQEKDEERNKRVEIERHAAQKKADRGNEITKIKQDLYALFDEGSAQTRGKKLETVLNNLFSCYGISVREAFVVTGQNNEGIVEQIDGVIEHKGHLYLVEMKWLKHKVGAPEITNHIGRITIRGGNVRGLYISYAGYAATASSTAEQFLATGALLVLSSLQEIVGLLEKQGDLISWLDKKINHALLERKSFVEVV